MIKIHCTDGAIATLVAEAHIEGESVLAIYVDRYLKSVKGIGASMCNNNKYLSVYGDDASGKRIPSYTITPSAEGYTTKYMRTTYNHDTCAVGLSVSKRVGVDVCITTKDNFENDVLNLLLAKGDLPLKREWIPYLLETLTAKEMVAFTDEKDMSSKDGVVQSSEVRSWEMSRYIKSGFVCAKDFQIPLKDSKGELKLTNFEDIIIFKINSKNFTEEAFEKIVSDGLYTKRITFGNENVPVEPLNLTSFDEYIQKFQKELITSLDKKVVPLEPTNYRITGSSLKTKRLYRGQRGCVNALTLAIRKGRRFALAVNEMGTGKTLCALTAVENHFNNKWLEEHPGKTLKDCYLSGEVQYRTVVTGPGHIVEKWAAEAENEVPDLKVKIVKDVADFEKIRAAGRARNGKEMYVISKDSLKLGSTISPTPTKFGRKKTPKRFMCVKCHNEGRTVIKPAGQTGASCPDCGGRHWKAYAFSELGHISASGMICPECGELLLEPNLSVKNGNIDRETLIASVLQPSDFTNKSSKNAVCVNCGAQLWGSNHRTVGNYEEPKTNWIKIKHYKNYSKKGTNTVWVYAPFENGERNLSFLKDYVETVPEKWYEPLKEAPGVRKFAPSEFIKKYLKGYFDVCILDECHKFESGDSAQTIAAGALVSVSNFTLGLTGTIANGKADSFFWLLFMLLPRKMKALGYSYDNSSLMEFVKKYGSIQTTYSKEKDGVYAGYNKSSRGGQRKGGKPKIAPGISPLLFVDFLLDSCCFLGMEDMADALPVLKEEVVPIELPEDILRDYNKAIALMKEAANKGEGMKILATMLMFSLAYPDMPFNTKPIMSTIQENTVIANPTDYVANYENKLLPKEEEMVNIIKKEQSEGRRAFVFASFTGNNSPLPRWKSIIEDKCSLHGKVAILESTTCSANMREEWIHRKAAEGMEVILCNCKLVETGLDFCFNHNGVFYNYPTIIFGQVTYELAVLWQASHRHYRLNQTEECRTYWLAYIGSAQLTALQIMGEKIVAVSAIQGKFSAGGLAAMAKGVDARLKLAESLKAGKCATSEEVKALFKDNTGGVKKDAADDDSKMLLYKELLGADYTSTLYKTEPSFEDFFNEFSDEEVYAEPATEVTEKAQDAIETTEEKEIITSEVAVATEEPVIEEVKEDKLYLIDLDKLIEDDVVSESEGVLEVNDDLFNFNEFFDEDFEGFDELKPLKKSSKKKSTKMTKVSNKKEVIYSGQLSIFDMVV